MTTPNQLAERYASTKVIRRAMYHANDVKSLIKDAFISGMSYQQLSEMSYQQHRAAEQITATEQKEEPHGTGTT